MKSWKAALAGWIMRSNEYGGRKFVNETPGENRPIGVERKPKSMQEILAKTIPPEGR